MEHWPLISFFAYHIWCDRLGVDKQEEEMVKQLVYRKERRRHASIPYLSRVQLQNCLSSRLNNMLGHCQKKNRTPIGSILPPWMKSKIGSETFSGNVPCHAMALNHIKSLTFNDNKPNILGKSCCRFPRPPRLKKLNWSTSLVLPML